MSAELERQIITPEVVDLFERMFDLFEQIDGPREHQITTAAAALASALAALEIETGNPQLIHIVVRTAADIVAGAYLTKETSS